MQNNGVANVGASANFDGSARVRLLDGGSRMTGFSDSTVSDRSKTVRVSGGGSIYEVTYQIPF
jgi:hypothetical protein